MDTETSERVDGMGSEGGRWCCCDFVVAHPREEESCFGVTLNGGDPEIDGDGCKFHGAGEVPVGLSIEKSRKGEVGVLSRKSSRLTGYQDFYRLVPPP